MAATYRTINQSPILGLGKSLIDVFNGANRVVKVVRMFHCVGYSGAATGVGMIMSVIRNKTSVPTGGTVGSFVYHDTTSSVLDANITTGTGRQGILDVVILNYLFDVSAPTYNGTSLSNWQVLLPVREIFSYGYGNSSISPLVLRQNYGVSLICANAYSNTNSDEVEIEFTEQAP